MRMGFCGVGLLISEPRSDGEPNRRLAMGRWKISLKSLAELRVALEVVISEWGSIMKPGGVCVGKSLSVREALAQIGEQS